jgi:predicted enzyme related to lactoylglutathione lyase
MSTTSSRSVAPRVLGVAYPSLYVRDLEAATAFYESLLGPVEYREKGLVGIRVGDTWLTLFDAHVMGRDAEGPRNTEFALRLGSPEDVDEMCRRFVAAGAKVVMPPADTRMYDAMRYACVDDPHGLRVGLYHPTSAPQ